MLIRLLVFLMTACSFCSTFCHAQDQTSTSDHQLNYPPGWEELISAWRQVEEAEYNETGSYVATVEGKLMEAGGKIRHGTNVWTIRTKPGCKHMSSKLGGEESVYARTSDYAFAVKRRPQESEWKLVQLIKDSKSDDTRRFEESAPGKYGLSVLYPLGTLLENNRASKYFYDDRIKSRVKDLKLIKGEKPRLEWTRHTEEYHASVVMDPAPNYITRHFESRRTDGKSLPQRTTFVRELMEDGKRPSSSLPLCKSVAYKIVADKEGGDTFNDVRITFSDYSFDPPPDDIFRLSHYGLPESLADSGSSSKLWLWMLVSAAGCLAVAFLFRHLSRRPAKAHSTGGKL